MATERRSPGAVRDAIIDAFKKSKRPMSSAEVRAAVSQALGEEVPASSIRSYLNLNTPARFERVGRGVYRFLR